jgi:septal ring factor EnvC (AmiA/AmiB activator)
MSVIKIMEQALEAMVEREGEIDKAIKELEARLNAAKAEKKRIAPAIREQRKVIAKVSGAIAVSSRPMTRREPKEGTNAANVLATVRAFADEGHNVKLDEICRSTGMTSLQVRPIVADLIKRGYVERVADGVYRPREARNG